MNEIIDIMDAQGKHLPIPTYTPDRDTDRRFRDALGFLVFRWSFFSSIIYNNMHLAYTRHTAVPIAGTDGHTIFLNPDGFISHGITDVLEIVFVKGHEVSHRVLNHIEISMVLASLGFVQLKSGERLPYIDQLMQWAQDYVINAMLVSGGIGRMPKIGLYDKTISEHGMESCIEAYEKLYRRHVKEVKLDPSLFKPGGFDIHFKPVAGRQTPKEKARLDQQIVAASLLQQRMKQGKLPGALTRIIDDLIHPKIKWEDHLRALMTRHAGDKQLDWGKQDRRLAGRDPQMFYAGVKRRGAGPLALGGDNSGSINAKQTKAFAGAMADIVDSLHPQRITILWCDAKVTRVDEVDEPDDLAAVFGRWKAEGVGGGGGTDFRPLFEKIEELEINPDFLVFFTDGYGTYPEVAPSYPVIWAMTTDKKPPFGEVVRVKV